MNFPNDPREMSKADFVAQFGGVYEHSVWIAEKACGHGLPMDANDVDTLCKYLRNIIETAGSEAQLTLLRAHPDLAGKLAKSGDLTDDSNAEQASAGLDQCNDAEFSEFNDLNNRYKTRFGFPYILAVKGRNRQEILANFRARIDNKPTVEFREALDQVHQIARLRLVAMC
ncbi:MAG: 2-oxo-4-hydroxy-4-carboxy-5-ureidoimidazoline decarboxylase [Paracoccaceae bacterium]